MHLYMTAMPPLANLNAYSVYMLLNMGLDIREVEDCQTLDTYQGIVNLSPLLPIDGCTSAEYECFSSNPDKGLVEVLGLDQADL